MTFAAGYNFLTYASIFSVGVPIAISLVKFRKLNRVLWCLLIFLLIGGLCDAVCVIYRENNALLNVFLNVFTILEGLLIFYIYKLELRKNKIIAVVFTFFSVICVWQFFILKQISVEDTVVSTMEALFVILLSGLYFHKQLSDDNITRPAKFYFFWINLSFLFYFGAGLLLFATNDFINRAPMNIASMLWGLHLLVNIGCNLLFAFGTWKIQKY